MNLHYVKQNKSEIPHFLSPADSRFIFMCVHAHVHVDHENKMGAIRGKKEILRTRRGHEHMIKVPGLGAGAGQLGAEHEPEDWCYPWEGQ